NAVSGATVNWTITSGSGQLGNLTTIDQGVTDSLGIAREAYIPTLQFTGSVTNPFQQTTIAATLVNGPSVTFYETQAFSNLASGIPQIVQVQLLTPSSTPSCANCISPGETLTGPAGSTSGVPFEVQVYAFGSSPSVVPNVSLRLISNQTSPSIS